MKPALFVRKRGMMAGLPQLESEPERLSGNRSEKPNRFRNLGFEERRGVIEAVKKRKDVTEDKRNDANANQKKQAAWTAVANGEKFS